MDLVFGDAFYYFALVNVRDAAHSRAVALGSRCSTRIVTSAWVIQELADGWASPRARAGFLRFWTALESDIYTEIVGPSEELWERGRTLYRSRADQSWSLTDCISFEIMRDRGITDALTADRHFQQAGFNAVLV